MSDGVPGRSAPPHVPTSHNGQPSLAQHCFRCHSAEAQPYFACQAARKCLTASFFDKRLDQLQPYAVMSKQQQKFWTKRCHSGHSPCPWSYTFAGVSSEA